MQIKSDYIPCMNGDKSVSTYLESGLSARDEPVLRRT